MAKKIIKPKQQEVVTEFVARPHLVDFGSAPAHAKFEKASKVLANIPGGFSRFVICRADGQFVPVVMLTPTEFLPAVVDGCQRAGAHVMVGVVDVGPAFPSYKRS